MAARALSGEPDPEHELVADGLIQRLRSCAQGLGLDDVRARQIVQRVIVEMPEADDAGRQDQAQLDMLVAVL